MVFLEEMVMKTFEDMWRIDKKIIQTHLPDIPIDPNQAFPTNKDATAIIVKRQERWEAPLQPFVLNRNSLNEVVEELVPAIEKLWKASFTERPNIEILPPLDYGSRYNEFLNLQSEQTGIPTQLGFTPSMGLLPSYGKIFVPQQFVARKAPPGDIDLLSTTYLEISMPWDKDFFEATLCGILASALFRQLRHEWKDEYLACLQQSDPQFQMWSSRLNEALAQYTKESLAFDKPSWQTHTLADQVMMIWSDRLKRASYLGVVSSTTVYSPRQMAMPDILIADKNGVYIGFDPNHPHTDYKQKHFKK